MRWKWKQDTPYTFPSRIVRPFGGSPERLPIPLSYLTPENRPRPLGSADVDDATNPSLLNDVSDRERLQPVKRPGVEEMETERPNRKVESLVLATAVASLSDW